MLYCIHSGTIPDDHVLDLFFFAFADENKEVNVHFQHSNYPNSTILYIFQMKKFHAYTRIHSSQYFLFCAAYFYFIFLKKKISCTA